jgi:serine/threonine-protein kinase
MYELLTGCAPFAGETTSDVLVALLSGEPRPLVRYVAELPATLQEIVNRALAKPVEERYQTARELGDDLRRLKEELEFAAKLKGKAGSKDDILTLMVGAAADVAEQTTFATRQVAEQMTFATRQVETAGSGFTAFRGWLARRGKSLALAAFVLVVLAAVGWWQWLMPRAAAIDSVAVLPFTNVGNDPQMEYLPEVSPRT